MFHVARDDHVARDRADAGERYVRARRRLCASGDSSPPQTEIAMAKNPGRYREASVPHEDIDKANEALSAFYDEVEALRTKHRIAQVQLTTQINYAGDNGEQSAYSVYHIGDALHH